MRLGSHSQALAWICITASLACQLPDQLIGFLERDRPASQADKLPTSTTTLIKRIPTRTPSPTITPSPSFSPTLTASSTASPTGTNTPQPVLAQPTTATSTFIYTPSTPSITPAARQITEGQDSWTMFSAKPATWIEILGGWVSPPVYNHSPVGYQFLRIDFTCDTGRSLIALYAGRDLGLNFIHNRRGYPDLRVADSTGRFFRATMLGECWLAAPVPPASRGFTLYFKQLPPLPLPY